MHDVAKYAYQNEMTLKDAALNNNIVKQNISEAELEILLNPETYIGLAIKQTETIINDIETKRNLTK